MVDSHSESRASLCCARAVDGWGKHYTRPSVANSCRPVMILGAFFTQTLSLMSDPNWKVIQDFQGPSPSVYGSQTSDATSDLSFLMEVLAELPVLFSQCNRCVQLARTRRSPGPHEGTIWSKTMQLQQSLQAWKAKWNDNNQSEVHKTLPITKVNSAQPVKWRTVFYFSNIEVANIFIEYHAVNILLTTWHMTCLRCYEPPVRVTLPARNMPRLLSILYPA